MRSASPGLQTYLANVMNKVPGTNMSPFVEDCIVVAAGQAQIAVNIKFFPVSGSVTVVPPALGNTPTTFVSDICVRQLADYSPLAWIPSGSPAVGQYTVNNSTGAYHFNSGDAGGKLITYVMGFGPFSPEPEFWTSGVQSIAFGSNVYTALGPFINRVKIKTSVGLQVDKIDMKLAALPTMPFPSTTIPIIQAFVQGYYDGAAVLVHRMVMPVAYGNVSLGGIVYFKGSMGELTEVGRTHAAFTIVSRAEILNRPIPRNTFQPACQQVLFGAGCTLNRASYDVTGTAQTGSNQSQIVINLTQPADAPGPSVAPTLAISTPSSGVNLWQRQEFAVTTYVSALGESLASPEANTSQFNAGAGLSGAELLTVDSPPSAGGVTGWNCYIGTSPGEEYLQNATPIPIGTNYTEPTTGPIQGSPPPILATNGYFSQGIIWFTSGANEGLSRVITTHTLVGSTPVLNVIPPFPNTVSIGDAFIVSPGCDKRYSTCSEKYNNLVHFFGYPFVPDPSQAL